MNSFFKTKAVCLTIGFLLISLSFAVTIEVIQEDSELYKHISRHLLDLKKIDKDNKPAILRVFYNGNDVIDHLFFSGGSNCKDQRLKSYNPLNVDEIYKDMTSFLDQAPIKLAAQGFPIDKFNALIILENRKDEIEKSIQTIRRTFENLIRENKKFE